MSVARVVCVHGIGQQFSGETGQHSSWFPALADGLLRTGSGALNADDVRCVFYGDVFRPQGRVLSALNPPLDASDVDPFDEELLLEMWQEAARTDPAVTPPGARTLARTPRSVQNALNALSQSRFFAGIAMNAMIASLKQVRAYLCDLEVYGTVQQRLADVVEADTRVVVGHSLGSVVAYEGLCAHPEWSVGTLITLGSPLGIRNLVFDRLRLPEGHKPGSWPGGIRSWTNIADDGDVVALVKDLRPLFGDRIDSHVVHNGSRAHDATRYLSASETGWAIAHGCAGQ